MYSSRHCRLDAVNLSVPDEVNVVVQSDPETVDKGKMKKYKLCTELEIPEGCFCFEVIGNIKLDAKITCPIAPKIR